MKENSMPDDTKALLIQTAGQIVAHTDQTPREAMATARLLEACYEETQEPAHHTDGPHEMAKPVKLT